MNITRAKLFHLHFFCKNMESYEHFLMNTLGFNLVGRYTLKDGLLPIDKNWKNIKDENIRLRLIELQKGSVNIVLMPGKFEKAKLEHFGFLLEPSLFKHTIEKAKELNLKVLERPNRTFISSNLGFRLEIHENSEDRRVNPEDNDELLIKKLSFSIENKEEFFSLLKELFCLDHCENRINIGDSIIEVTEGSFSLESFLLGGNDELLSQLRPEQLPAGFPMSI